jgi:hypothetical protein
VHQIFFEAMTIENIAAAAFQIDAARLAGLPFVRWKFLAGIPQCIFPHGPNRADRATPERQDGF